MRTLKQIWRRVWWWWSSPGYSEDVRLHGWQIADLKARKIAGR